MIVMARSRACSSSGGRLVKRPMITAAQGVQHITHHVIMQDASIAAIRSISRRAKNYVEPFAIGTVLIQDQQNDHVLQHVREQADQLARATAHQTLIPSECVRRSSLHRPDLLQGPLRYLLEDRGVEPLLAAEIILDGRAD